MMSDDNVEDKTDKSPASSTSLFTVALSKYLKKDEKLGDPISNEDIAKLANTRFAKGVDIKDYKMLIEKIVKSSNCKSVTQVRENELIWNLIRAYKTIG